jgi:hypothetical protein
MVAVARGFHKCEDKPFWWAHFNRLDNPIDEWADTTGVFIVETAEIEEVWREPRGREKKPRRRLRLHGELEAGDLALGGAFAMTRIRRRQAWITIPMGGRATR